eukprot:GCRY01002954.1.p1 GENE.GCRY01002954.1~~GCRY01002954.1.p1  ORF type:complete len:706 (+),score=181.27 GCRY01002954.1:673-2790(+)
MVNNYSSPDFNITKTKESSDELTVSFQLQTLVPEFPNNLHGAHLFNLTMDLDRFPAQLSFAANHTDIKVFSQEVDLVDGEGCSLLSPLNSSPGEFETIFEDVELSQRFSSHISLTIDEELAHKQLNSAGFSGKQLKQAIASSMTYLEANFRTQAVAVGIPPCGFAMNGYNGHIFWDMDTWMLPAILPFRQDVAWSLLQYRVDRLDQARTRAKAEQRRGAKYPWESAATGMDTTPAPHPEGKLEIHIGADVALALLQYATVLDNRRTFLDSKGFTALHEILSYFESRMHKGFPCDSAHRVFAHGNNNTAGTCFGVRGVQPPDESAVHEPENVGVDNSAYTNAAVASAFLNFVAVLGDYLQNSFDWQEILLRFSDIAESFYLPYNETAKIHPEYSGYDGHMINQADVGLLQYPLGIYLDADVANNDLTYYINKTRPDGYYTGDSTYVVALLSLGRTEEATKLFVKGFDLQRPPFNLWTERHDTVGHINFLTGAGGFLQSIIYGYGGMRIDPALGLTFAPTPLATAGFEDVRELKFNDLAYSTWLLDIVINATHFIVSGRQTSTQDYCPALQVQYHTASKTFDSQATVNISVNPYPISLAESDSITVSCLRAPTPPPPTPPTPPPHPPPKPTPTPHPSHSSPIYKNKIFYAGLGCIVLVGAAVSVRMQKKKKEQYEKLPESSTINGDSPPAYGTVVSSTADGPPCEEV